MADSRSPTHADFNPDGDDRIDRVKAKADELIDLIEELAENKEGEARRRFALARTNIEQGAMWAVKALCS
jgi:hypothetical protein